MRLLLLVLALSSSASAELLGTLSGAIKGVGDGRVATVACCGASKIGASTVLSAAATKPVEVMPGSTAVALVSGGDVAESAMAVASSDVVLLELRLSDLEADGPHGIAQLAPLLQRSLKLRALKPGKKLLVLVVSEDEEPSPRAELSALVSGALERLWASIRKPEDAAKLSLPDAFEAPPPHPRCRTLAAASRRRPAGAAAPPTPPLLPALLADDAARCPRRRRRGRRRRGAARPLHGPERSGLPLQGGGVVDAGVGRAGHGQGAQRGGAPAAGHHRALGRGADGAPLLRHCGAGSKALLKGPQGAAKGVGGAPRPPRLRPHPAAPAMGPAGPPPAPSLPTDRPPRQATALPDFGERLGSLIDDSIAKYSADAAQLGGSPTVATARSALLSQITRAATPTCRRQLKLLQVQSRERFMQKLAALKPSLKAPCTTSPPLAAAASLPPLPAPPSPAAPPTQVEAELRTMVKEAATKFEADAKAALPPTLPLSYSFEKQAVVTSMAEAAKAQAPPPRTCPPPPRRRPRAPPAPRPQVELWRVQGLYLPLDGFKTPVDIGLHWLLPRPFGVDSRYDSISSRDKPKFRPRAAPMKVRAMDGYKARGLQDPKDMVFDAKMS